MRSTFTKDICRATLGEASFGGRFQDTIMGGSRSRFSRDATALGPAPSRADEAHISAWFVQHYANHHLISDNERVQEGFK